MLGFIPLSQAPLSHVTTAETALGYLTTLPSYLNINSISYDAKSHIVPISVTSLIEAAPVQYIAKANIATHSVITLAEVSDFTTIAKANYTLGTTSAYLTIYIGDFADEDAQARVYISPAVSVAQAVSVAYDAESNIILYPVTATVENNILDYEGLSFINLNSVSGLFEQTFTYELHDFDYQQYANSYERHRTLYLLSDIKGHTVYIPERESTMVYVSAQDDNRTVTIAERDSTMIYLGAQETNRTVKIAA